MKIKESIMKLYKEYPNWNHVGNCSHLEINNECKKCGRYWVIENGLKRFYLVNGYNYLNHKLSEDLAGDSRSDYQKLSKREKTLRCETSPSLKLPDEKDKLGEDI